MVLIVEFCIGHTNGKKKDVCIALLGRNEHSMLSMFSF